MSKVKHSIAADEELVMNGVTTAGATSAEVDAIHLGGGQEWDDTVLIRGWEAAKEEFHLHHPGPGSWLDKQTAALSVGTALAGAKHGDSEWYSATSAVPTSSSTTAEAQAMRVKLSKRKADGGSGSVQAKRTRVQSPSYTPASPSQQNLTLDPEFKQEQDEQVDEEDYELYVEDVDIGPEASGSYPAPYASAGHATSREDALQKSMQAQWWAGYWYGFYASQAASASAPLEAESEPSWAKSPYESSTATMNGTSKARTKRAPYKAHKARRAAKIAEHEQGTGENAPEGEGLVEPGVADAGESGEGKQSHVGSALKR